MSSVEDHMQPFCSSSSMLLVSLRSFQISGKPQAFVKLEQQVCDGASCKARHYDRRVEWGEVGHCTCYSGGFLWVLSTCTDDHTHNLPSNCFSMSTAQGNGRSRLMSISDKVIRKMVP